MQTQLIIRLNCSNYIIIFNKAIVHITVKSVAVNISLQLCTFVLHLTLKEEWTPIHAILIVPIQRKGLCDKWGDRRDCEGLLMNICANLSSPRFRFSQLGISVYYLHYTHTKSIKTFSEKAKYLKVYKNK